jgi:hypothetical protein
MMMRGRMFDLLFDLLKGKMDQNTFEKQAAREMEGIFNEMYKRGYEKWVTIALSTLLAPDRAYRINLPSLDTDGGTPLGKQESAPDAHESDTIKLEYVAFSGFYSFIVPELMVHSGRLGKFVSIRNGFGDVLSIADNATKKREWLRFGPGRIQGPAFLSPVLIAYTDDELIDISLVADNEKVCVLIF